MTLSIMFICLWLAIGFIGIGYDEKDRANWFMIIYIAFVPVFPFIFHWCGLF